MRFLLKFLAPAALVATTILVDPSAAEVKVGSAFGRVAGLSFFDDVSDKAVVGGITLRGYNRVDYVKVVSTMPDNTTRICEHGDPDAGVYRHVFLQGKHITVIEWWMDIYEILYLNMTSTDGSGVSIGTRPEEPPYKEVAPDGFRFAGFNGYGINGVGVSRLEIIWAK